VLLMPMLSWPVAAPIAAIPGAMVGVTAMYTVNQAGQSHPYFEFLLGNAIIGLSAISLLYKIVRFKNQNLIPKNNIRNIAGIFNWDSKWNVQLNTIINKIETYTSNDNRWWFPFNKPFDDYKLQLVAEINSTKDTAIEEYKTHKRNPPPNPEQNQQYTSTIQKIILLHCLFNRFIDNIQVLNKINILCKTRSWDALFDILGNIEKPALLNHANPDTWECPALGNLIVPPNQQQVAAQQPPPGQQQQAPPLPQAPPPFQAPPPPPPPAQEEEEEQQPPPPGEGGGVLRRINRKRTRHITRKQKYKK